MHNRIVLALVALGSLALAGCQNWNTQTSAAGWEQIAVGTGQVIGKTKADEKVAKASVELAKYCGALQAVAVGATIFAPERQKSAAAMAAAAVNTVCANPPSDVASALTTAAAAYGAVIAAQQTATP
ncbi:hypothetical protein AB6806_27625 [Bosea sp. RCC_152_1]|uniref:hypothetical protein n=1 Tax=Bosea sp. RCC_152_1 TaxID=3239228 RepID=UPI003523C111